MISINGGKNDLLHVASNSDLDLSIIKHVVTKLINGLMSLFAIFNNLKRKLQIFAIIVYIWRRLLSFMAVEAYFLSIRQSRLYKVVINLVMYGCTRSHLWVYFPSMQVWMMWLNEKIKRLCLLDHCTWKILDLFEHRINGVLHNYSKKIQNESFLSLLSKAYIQTCFINHNITTCCFLIDAVINTLGHVISCMWLIWVLRRFDKAHALFAMNTQV